MNLWTGFQDGSLVLFDRALQSEFENTAVGQ